MLELVSNSSPSKHVLESHPCLDARSSRITASKAIVRDVRAYQSWNLQSLDDCVAHEIEVSAKTIFAGKSRAYLSRVRTLTRLFDCYLDVTGEVFQRSAPDSQQEQVFLRFAGALLSTKFLLANYRYRRTLLVLLRQIASAKLPGIEKAFPATPCLERLENWKPYVYAFENTELRENAVEKWRAWPITGHFACHWLDLRKVSDRFGPNFATNFMQAAQSYHTGRRTQAIGCLTTFISYLTALPGNWTTNSFRDPSHTHQLFSRFAIYYVTTSSPKTSFSHLAKSWKDFVYFLHTAAFPENMFTKPLNGLPNIPDRASRRNAKHVRTNAAGKIFSSKSITDIPLYLSTQEATDELFKRADADLHSILNWANDKASEIWHRYEEFLKLSKEGGERTIGPEGTNETEFPTNREALTWKKNVATTFTQRGFTASTNLDAKLTQYYGKPLSQAAHLLAIPVKGTFLGKR